VAKPSVRVYALLVIREVILEIDLISVMTVGKPLIREHASCSIGGSTQERSPIHVPNVVKLSHSHYTYKVYLQNDFSDDE